MKNKLFLTFGFAAALCGSAFAQSGGTTAVAEPYKFTPTIQLDATSVKNQGRTGTCWCFSTISFCESEAFRNGLSDLNLSEMYIVRNIYEAKAANYIRRQGNARFSQGGLAHDMLNAMRKNGIVPQVAYNNDVVDGAYNHGELEKNLKAYLDHTIETLNDHPLNWKSGVDSILDTFFGPEPKIFEFKGKEYTPESYFASLSISPDDYVTLTSFTHHPFYSEFILEIPDNWANGSYYNVSLDELMQVVDNSLEKGYTIAWDTDVSNKGFSAKNGLAIVPAYMQSADKASFALNFASPSPEKQITQNYRQQLFDNYTTTDDHLMHITGKVKDQNGDVYYIVKNSWGKNVSDLKGYLYASDNYVQLNTIGITVHKSVLSEALKQKLGI